MHYDITLPSVQMQDIYLGDMWFWDSVLQSLPTVVIRSVLTSQLLTSPGPVPGPLSSASGSWTRRRGSKDERRKLCLWYNTGTDTSHQTRPDSSSGFRCILYSVSGEYAASILRRRVDKQWRCGGRSRGAGLLNYSAELFRMEIMMQALRDRWDKKSWSLSRWRRKHRSCSSDIQIELG